jgi:predicted kinase
MDALASKLAQFHDHAAVAAANSAWGSPDTIRLGACDNLASIASLVDEAPEKEWVADMQTWQEAQQEILADTFESRKARGRIRECHGDLHCGNILTINDRVGVFDCIEFNESLRWIDVMDDMAFICMDLKFQKRPDLAARLLNRYLEISGDYEGLAVLRYYQVERALVRCKVTLLRGRQVRADAQDATSYVEQAAQYMAFSSENIKPATVALVITHGYSGSGKSAIARCLVEFLGAIQIRSDVERKRMHGLSAISSAAAAPGAGLYDVAATNLTYGRLRALARHVIESGLPVIVDAACLRQEQRCQFERLARELAVPFFILDVQASEATIRERIVLRAQSGRDPSDAGLHILAYQVAHHDRFSDDELKHVISVDGETCWTMEAIRDIAAPIRRALSAGTCA